MVPSAIRDANYNVSQNNLSGKCAFICGKAEDKINEICATATTVSNWSMNQLLSSISARNGFGLRFRSAQGRHAAKSDHDVATDDKGRVPGLRLVWRVKHNCPGKHCLAVSRPVELASWWTV